MWLHCVFLVWLVPPHSCDRKSPQSPNETSRRPPKESWIYTHSIHGTSWYIYPEISYKINHSCKVNTPGNHGWYGIPEVLVGRLFFWKKGWIGSHLLCKDAKSSGQIIIFHQPRCPWNKKMSLTFHNHLGEIGRVRSLIWPESSSQ